MESQLGRESCSGALRVKAEHGEVGPRLRPGWEMTGHKEALHPEISLVAQPCSTPGECPLVTRRSPHSHPTVSLYFHLSLPSPVWHVGRQVNR